MVEWSDWGDGWLKEGYYITYAMENQRHYELVIARDFAHYEYMWEGGYILPGTTSGHYIPEYLEVTKRYDSGTHRNQIWQVIFGIKPQVLIYVELPTDIYRHGLPKLPKPSTGIPWVSHFESWMSPYDEPTFVTEHFMMRPSLDRIAFSAFNPNAQVVLPWLRFFVAKCETERIGTLTVGEDTPPALVPTSKRWTDVLDKLYKGTIPCRPITLYPVRAPAEGE